MQKKQKIILTVSSMLVISAVVIGCIWGIPSIRNNKDLFSPKETPLEVTMSESDTMICEVQYDNISLSEALQESRLILKGRYKGPQKASSHIDHVFDELEIFRGEYPDSTLSLCEYPQRPLEGTYEIGEEYLLVLGKTVSVYLEHDEYYPYVGFYVPLTSSTSMLMQGRPLGENEEELEFMENPIQFLSKIPAPAISQTENIDGTPYTHSDSWHEILSNCEYVLKLEIGNSILKNENRGTEAFDCNVLDVYKGGEVIGDIILSFFDGMVEQGKEYVALLERVDGEDSLVFALAAKENVVFPADSAKAQEIIQAIENGGETK